LPNLSFTDTRLRDRLRFLTFGILMTLCAQLRQIRDADLKQTRTTKSVSDNGDIIPITTNKRTHQKYKKEIS